MKPESLVFPEKMMPQKKFILAFYFTFCPGDNKNTRLRFWNCRMRLKNEFCPQSDGVAICMLLANIYRAKINFLRGIRLVKTNLSSASAM